MEDDCNHHEEYDHGLDSDDGSVGSELCKDDDGGYPSRITSGTQDCSKNPTERDDGCTDREEADAEDGCHGPVSDDDSIGSDLYKDDDDRERLARLTEFQRELILADRACRRRLAQMTELERGMILADRACRMPDHVSGKRKRRSPHSRIPGHEEGEGVGCHGIDSDHGSVGSDPIKEEEDGWERVAQLSEPRRERILRR